MPGKIHTCFPRVADFLSFKKENIFQANNGITINMHNGTGQFSCVFKEYDTNIKSLNKEQILQRMLVIKNFLFYKKSTIESITQNEYSNFDELTVIFVDNVSLYVKDGFCIPFNCFVKAGFWCQNVYVGGIHNYYYGFDVISLHTYLLRNYNRKYSDSINELYEHFSTRSFIQRADSLSPKEFFVQEVNPISHYSPIFFDTFLEKFAVNNIFPLANRHNRIIGSVWDITAACNSRMEIYFTCWRHQKSNKYSIFPLPPPPPYELNFSSDALFCNTKIADIFVCNSIEMYSSEKLPTRKNCIVRYVRTNGSDAPTFLPSIIYGGCKNLQHANLFHFSNMDIHFYFEKSMNIAFLKAVSDKCSESNVSSCTVWFKDENICSDPNDIIKNPEVFGIECSEKNTGIRSADDKMPGEDRKRKMILDPIIESGTITWLFGKEKSGKTLLALYLAQIIGLGGKSLGPWKSSARQRVLYIDGEMPADKLKSHIEKITRGLTGNNNNFHRSFSVFLFGEEGWDYDGILDEEWQNKHIDDILKYDLVILDNYYTLYPSQNPIKLIRWMKRLTKLGIAFLVLDHTNADGELQGSKIKRRAMDLGLKIKFIQKSKIIIEYEHDRYGKEHIARKFSLNITFSQTKILYSTDKIHIVNENADEQLTDKELELIAILILKKTKIYNKLVAEKIGRSAITKQLHELGVDKNLSPFRPTTKTEILYEKIDKLSSYYSDKEKLDALIEQVRSNNINSQLCKSSR